MSDFGRFLWNFFRHSPSKVYSFGIIPVVCFWAAVNLLFLISHLTGNYLSTTSSEFVIPCLFIALAIWVVSLSFFAGYEITNEKISEKLAKMLS